jgi:ATP-dependent Clp protease adaptor protein ClpS
MATGSSEEMTEHTPATLPLEDDPEVVTETRTQKPPMYKVIMLNDDYTPMDLVVQILRGVFRKSEEEAITIMLEIHNKGSGLCGIYTRDVAETKCEQVVTIARMHEYPLQCVTEQA